MKTLILVSKTQIVVQIFNLICKKLYISLEVIPDAQIDHKVDIIVIDKNLIDDRFSILKTYCKLVGAISNEELPFEMANDFLIPSPFLPSTLEKILEIQLQEITKRANAKTYVTNVEQPIELDTTQSSNISPELNIPSETDTAVDYIESAASSIANDINEDNDDSIVPASMVSEINGGILDENELSKLENIIDYNTTTLQDITKEYNQEEIDKEEDEWMDLSSIIDKAIDEVNSADELYDKLENKPIKLLLNNYSMNELKPLFELLNQDIIDALADGQEITLQLKLGIDNNG